MDIEITTHDIYKGIWKKYLKYDYPMINAYIFLWESDFFCISKSGYSYEIEVKRTYSDFKADFKKRDKYKILRAEKPYAKKTGRGYTAKCKNGFVGMNDGKLQYYSYHHWLDEKQPVLSNIQIIKPCERKPNKFIYACPKGMIDKDEIPEWSGLIYVTKSISGRVTARYEKRPSFLHKNKIDFSERLLKKYMWEYKKQQNKIYF